MASQGNDSTTNNNAPVAAAINHQQRGVVLQPVTFSNNTTNNGALPFVLVGNQQIGGVIGTPQLQGDAGTGMIVAQQQQQLNTLNVQGRQVNTLNVPQVQYAQVATTPGINPYVINQQPQQAAIFPQHQQLITTPGSASGGAVFLTGPASNRAMQIPSNMNLAVTQLGGIQGYPLTSVNFQQPAASTAIATSVPAPQQVASLHQSAVLNQPLLASSAAVLQPGSIENEKASAKAPPKKEKKEEPARAMPVRPLSAYNFFFLDERAKILNDGKDDTDPNDPESLEKKKKHLLEQHLKKDRTKRRPHRKTHGKIAFTTLSKLIGKRWKELKDEDRKFYLELAAEDMERYQRDVSAYNEGRLFSSAGGTVP